MILKDKIFREYDIRGVVGVDFDGEFAKGLGRAFAEFLRSERNSQGLSNQELKVAIGHDCRLSKDELTKGLIEGLLSSGVDVVNTGMGPTPQLYFSVFNYDLAGGIQVTGSHNPADQNGFKMLVGKRTLSGSDIQQLKAIIHRESVNKVSTNRGKEVSVDARQDYIKDLSQRSLPQMKRKLRVVVDAGNGVGGLVGPQVLRNLGCEVIELYTDPDGRFPNHHPDPSELKNIEELRKRVVLEKADLGIAWDGDADRIGVVDEKGKPILGDMLLIIYGRQLVKEVNNPTVIGDVKCSELLFADLKKHGANPVIAKTGHSLIKAKMKELNAELAGEMSGHMFFAHRYYGFDDAIHASARLVEILSNSEMRLSEMLSDLPKTVSTPEIRLDCPEEIKFKVAEKAKTSFPEYQVNTLDGVRIAFPHGWGLVRASNTQAVLVMRFEANSENELQQYKNIVEQRIHALCQEMTN